MSETTKQQARRIFMAVVDLPDSERAGAVARECGGETLLRAEVEALLRADRGAGAFLAHPTGPRPQVPTPADPSSTEAAGAMIGRYKLLEQIGEGGMGTIWMAEQRESVKRRVALKIIKLGMDTRQVIARFEAERQALAMMDHPNIAKVLDAGATEAGRPYFVMEYIRGVPILEYCDQAKLDTKARLDLFGSVCHAIQHAHQKGIIHRDIKPDNVLVTLHDGVPVCKVIDFGIAKATSAELTTKTLFTEHRQMIGTPAYMSPEQAEMSGLDIDTRSDIYSLGVLLYELLTGTTPFDTKELLAKGFAEMMRAIREDEPHKPSTRISALGDTAARTARQRHVDVRKLGLLLRGDLDWIVMKCLEKDRTRRYETANALAADLVRHLQNEPVTAAAPSAGYKLRKFVKRNRAQVIAGVIVAAVLVLGLVGTGLGLHLALDEKEKASLAAEAESVAKVEAQQQAQRAGEQATLAEAARQQEAEARANAELIADFMSDTLEGAGPSVAKGRDITLLKEMMDAAALRIERGDLKAAPEAELQLRGTIGNTYRELAVYDAAHRMLEPAVALARATHAGDHEAVVHSLHRLVWLLQTRGDFAGAEPLVREALAISKRLHPGDHVDVVTGLDSLAKLLGARGDPSAAEPCYRDALKMCKRLFPGDHLLVATCLNNLAKLLNDRGNSLESEQLYREALEMSKRLFPGDDHPSVASGLSNLATLLQQRGNLAEAEPLLREALEMHQRLFSGDHPDVASSLHNLASLELNRGDFSAAEPILREALEMIERLLPADHPEVLKYKANLATCHWSQGELDHSTPLFEQVLAAQEAKIGRQHFETLMTVANLGANYQDAGRLTEAIPLLEEAFRNSKKYPVLSFVGLRLLEAYAAASDPARKASELPQAEQILRQTLEAEQRLFRGDHPRLVQTKHSLAVVFWKQGKLDLSIPLFEEVVAAEAARSGRQHPVTLSYLANLGVNYKDAGRLAEAIPLLEEAYKNSEEHPRLRWVGTQLLDAYAKAVDPARPDETVRVVALSLDLLVKARAVLPEGSPQLAVPLALCAQSLLMAKAWDEAEPLLREALSIREQAQPDEWTTFNSKSMLGAALLGQQKLTAAETLLLDGYLGMKEREAAIPPEGLSRILETLERLVQLYESRGDPIEAAAWRGKLEEARTARNKTARDGGR